MSAATAIAAATPSSITVQLLTGEQREVELPPQPSYAHLYLHVWNQLPEEIRTAGGVNQMNLLLEGELVPMEYGVPAVLSTEVYHVLMDTVRYEVSLMNETSYAIDHNHPQETTYRVWDMVVESSDRVSDTSQRFIGTILYDKDTGRYHTMEDIAHEWTRTRYDTPVLHVWIEPDRETITAVDAVAYLMDCVERLLSPSLAGKRRIQEMLESELTTKEEE